VESPALVPDFAPAWASAYEKAKVKVGNLASGSCYALEHVHPIYAECIRHVECNTLPRSPDFAFYLILSRFKIATFTLEQKVNITTGVGAAVGRCVGNTPPVDDFPGLCLEDSPLGVRAADFVTLFPAGINAATT
jgi:hypothetical protein